MNSALTLRVFHAIMTFAHTLTATLMLVYTPEFRVHINTIGDFRVGVLSGVFLALAAVDHVVCVVFWEYYTTLVEDYQHKAVWLRWCEYSISASVMNVAILLMCRCEYVSFLLFVPLLTTIMMMCGMASEPTQHNENNALLIANGWCCFAAIWITIVYFFAVAAKDGVPGFVIAIVVVLFVLETSFGVVHLVASSKVDSVEDSYKREIAYTMLSLASKLSLALITYQGTKARSSL